MSVATLNNRIMKKLLEKGKPFRSVSALHHVGKLMRNYHLGTYDEIANEIALLKKNIIQIEGKNRFLKSQSQKDFFQNKQFFELKEDFPQNYKDDLQLSNDKNTTHFDKNKFKSSNYDDEEEEEKGQKNQKEVKCKNEYKKICDGLNNGGDKDKNYNFLIKTKQILQESTNNNNKNYSLYPTNQKGQQSQTKNVDDLNSNRSIKEGDINEIWNENNSNSNICSRNKACLYCNGTINHFDSAHPLKNENDKIYKSTDNLDKNANILQIQLSPISSKTTKNNKFISSSLTKNKKTGKMSLIKYNKNSKPCKITANNCSNDNIKQTYQLFKEAKKRNKKSASSSNIFITPLIIPDKDDLKIENKQEEDLITSPRSEVSDLFSSNRNQLQANLKLLSNIKLKVKNEKKATPENKEKNIQCKNKKDVNNVNDNNININKETKNNNEINSTKNTRIIRCLPCFMGFNKSSKTIQENLKDKHIHFKKIKKLSDNHQKKESFAPAFFLCNTARADKLIRSYYELM